MQPMWIMIAGPYTSGAKTEHDREANLEFLNQIAWEVFRKGHIPIVGVNAVLPIIEANELDENIVLMPLCIALAKRCDAVLRVGGDSKGADAEVATIREQGGRVFESLEDVPSLSAE